MIKINVCMLTKYDWIFPLLIVGSIHTRDIEWAVRDSFLKDVTSEGTKTKSENAYFFISPVSFFIKFRTNIWESGVSEITIILNI